jgi:hypothetical protein
MCATSNGGPQRSRARYALEARADVGDCRALESVDHVLRHERVAANQFLLRRRSAKSRGTRVWARSIADVS